MNNSWLLAGRGHVPRVHPQEAQGGGRGQEQEREPREERRHTGGKLLTSPQQFRAAKQPISDQGKEITSEIICRQVYILVINS